MLEPPKPATPPLPQRWFLVAVVFVLVLPVVAQVRPAGWWALFSVPIAIVLGLLTGWVHARIVTRWSPSRRARIVVALVLGVVLLSTLLAFQWVGTDRKASPTWFYEGGAER